MARGRDGDEGEGRVFSGRSVSTLGGEGEKGLTFFVMAFVVMAFFVMLNLVQHPSCPKNSRTIRRNGP